MKDSNQGRLLPSGFADILPPAAARESRTTAILLKSMAAFGYAQVKPPLMEFSGNDVAESQRFRVMDPVSQEMMAVRADITPQVVRIATTRLEEEPRPLRLCYAGEVLRVSGEGLYRERQLTQAGAELIGVDSAQADTEAVIVAITALANAGITDVSVDFSIPGLVTLLGADEKSMTLISRKDASALAKKGTKGSTLFAELINLAGSATQALKALEALDMPREAVQQIQRLTAIVSAVRRAFPDLVLTIDPLEHRGFEYYTGVSFAIFSQARADELGRGGRYEIGKNKEHGVGFALSVNAALRALPGENEKDRIYVPAETTYADILRLQQEGLITILATDDKTDPKTVAKNYGCGWVYQNGKKSQL